MSEYFTTHSSCHFCGWEAGVGAGDQGLLETTGNRSIAGERQVVLRPMFSTIISLGVWVC